MCPSCPTATKAIQPNIEIGYLKFHDFRRLIDENPHVRQVELSNYGEMLLHPNLLEIFQYAHSKGVHLTADNGVNFNTASEDILEGLVQFGFRSMTCSIDGVSEETYKKYRVNGRLQNVLENIKRINSYKEQHHTKYPQLTWQFIVFGHNEHEIRSARKLASELKMRFRVKLNWESQFSPVKDRKYLRKMIGSASRDEFEEQYNLDYMHRICHQLWNQPQINWDGKILGCNRNFWGDFGGNSLKDGLIASLNNERFKYARNMLQGKFDARDDIPCSTCDIYRKRKESRKWLKRQDILIDKMRQLVYGSPILNYSPIRTLIKKISTRMNL
jgi:MoaA/NifB/PqqE/SkfB family radical SAM enzyme